MHGNEPLLRLMLFDLQNSKFSLRLKPNEMGNVSEPVAKMADALWNHRTKLNATLARMRVEGGALRISQLIPDQTTRETFESNKTYPCHARVNPIKVRDIQTQVVDRLLNDGFVQVKAQDNLSEHKKSVCLLQEDLLVFSPDCRGMLDEHDLVENGFLVLQVGPLNPGGIWHEEVTISNTLSQSPWCQKDKHHHLPFSLSFIGCSKL